MVHGSASEGALDVGESVLGANVVGGRLGAIVGEPVQLPRARRISSADVI